MEMSGVISIVCLTVIASVCVVGVFGPYRDNTLQRIGMSAIAVWCVLRIDAKLETGETEAVHLWLHIGLAIYSVGAAIRQHKLLKALRACEAKDCNEFRVFWK